MKILYYNWTPLEKKKEGGGVAVYMRNLLDYLQRSDLGLDVTFMSSGYYYDGGDRPYIRKEKDMYGASVFSIVNSPIIAPQGFPESVFAKCSSGGGIVNVFKQFLDETGPYDIIHFNSFEGISAKVLELKECFSQTKFIHSMHDYGILCPKVQFWTLNGTNCVTDKDHPLCKDCVKVNQRQPMFLHKYFRPSSPYSKKTHNLKRVVLKWTRSFAKRSYWFYNRESHSEATYSEFRKTNVDCINEYADAELVVSRRVGEIAQMYGINKEKIRLSYIGTKFADSQLGHCRSNGGDFTLLYMGYMLKAKGFYSYLSALETLDESVAANIRLKFASRISDKSAYRRVLALKRKFKGVTFHNGYTHADFPKIMDGVSLGVVPPLWEDNLPQVALEMIANGIPVLASGNGGAHELNAHPMFKFDGLEDLKGKIAAISKDKSYLEDYWNFAVRLTTMEEHVGQLLDIYKS